jgi:hypothetical protein
MESDCNDQLDVWQSVQQWLPPGFGTPFHGQMITPIACAGIAKAHRNDGNVPDVVEHLPANTHPVSQPVAAGVVEGDAGLMNPGTRGLPGYENSRSGMHTYDRAWAQWEFRLAQPAFTHAPGKGFE